MEKNRKVLEVAYFSNHTSDFKATKSPVNKFQVIYWPIVSPRIAYIANLVKICTRWKVLSSVPCFRSMNLCVDSMSNKIYETNLRNHLVAFSSPEHA